MKIHKEELQKHDAFYVRDNEFSSYCRYLQSVWRESKGFSKAKEKLGNYLDLDFSRHSKANFLTPKIGKLVEREVNNSKNSGKLISEPRIWYNLLSSQPLAFNLFGEFADDMNSATFFFRELFPEIIGIVTGIIFEYSPGRSNDKFTGDKSAFDVFVEYEAKDKKKRGFLGIEVKYVETLSEESKSTAEKIFKNHGSRYCKIAKTSMIFKADIIEDLKIPPLSQIWRDHLLAISLQSDYDEGYFVFLSPLGNVKCQQALRKYQEYLINQDFHKNLFIQVSLETCAKALTKLNSEFSDEFTKRYIGRV